jgi:hypothetical protein
MLYGVETKEINQAVKNNPDKFPDEYILELEEYEKTELVKTFDRFNKLKHSTAYPKAFTEKGLYILDFADCGLVEQKGEPCRK